MRRRRGQPGPSIRLDGIDKTYVVRTRAGRHPSPSTRGAGGGRGVVLRRGGGDGRLPRPERRREVDHDQDDHRDPDPVGRPDRGARASAPTKRSPGADPADRGGVRPALPAVVGSAPRPTRSTCCTTSTAPTRLATATTWTFVERLDLGDLLAVPVRQLSLGQRMRGELTAALLHDPALVVLDEPTIGLDVVSKYAVREFLAETNRERGTTVLLTTHDLDDVEQLCRADADHRPRPGAARRVGRRVQGRARHRPDPGRRPGAPGAGARADHRDRDRDRRAPTVDPLRPGHLGGPGHRRGDEPGPRSGIWPSRSRTSKTSSAGSTPRSDPGAGRGG